jgi:biotin carboxyl carrier protein
MKYQAKSAQGNTFEIEIQDKNTLLINNELHSIDILNTGEISYHAIHQHTSYNIHITQINKEEKTIEIMVNGNKYAFEIKDTMDLLLHSLGLGASKSNKLKEMKAPMPGLVLQIPVNEGDEVKKGDSILILEAMKMENVIKSPIDGKIKKINIKKSEAVEKGHLLISFE